MKTAARRLALSLCTLFCATGVHAARPMITDDARIVDAKACQVESWVRFNPGSQELWAVPACNPTGNLELSFGGGRTREGGPSAFTDAVFQAKTVLRPLDERWGVGLAAGTVVHPRREQARGWPGDPYLYVPLSVKVRGDDWVVHLNAGVARHRDENRDILTWGVGNEIRLHDNLYFIPEMFASDRGRPFWQAGFRYWLVKDRIQMDATYGNRAVSESSERWISVGVRLLSPPFLP